MEQATEKQIGFAKKLGIDKPEQYDKQALRGLIDVELKKQKPEEKVEVVKPYEQDGSKHATMYVSYAKDIFLGLLNSITREGAARPADDLMKKAIELVKQAREEFE